MSDMRRREGAGGVGELQMEVAAKLADPGVVPDDLLGKVLKALGVPDRSAAVSLVRVDLAAAKLTAKIIRTAPAGAMSLPELSSPEPSAPAATRKGGRGLSF